ncbi:choice-of-anchor D domain-containing protein [bacterium]|nr:choice-of-anchor D domain-containing protein [bacterium]MBU1983765.1 choice-of-anchor D domain-containing protein [bacterium]
MIARSRLKLAMVALLMGGLCLCTIGYAEITSVQISPAQPTDQDTITFSVAGLFLDGCWNLRDFNFNQMSSTQFSADVFAYDVWQPGQYCPLFIVDYVYSATFGPLDPGTYSIFVTEHHQSLREPEPNFASLMFEVMDFLPPAGISVIPESLAFGNVYVAHDSVLMLTIQNIGGAPLAVTAMTAPTGFTARFGLPLTIAPDSSVTGSVQFRPTTAQPYSGNLVIISNASTSPTHVPLSGIGIQESSADNVSVVIPGDFYLVQNYPNPFNPTTTISFSLPHQSRAYLSVFDALGREVRVLADENFAPGEHHLLFDGSDLPSGIYFAQLQSGEFVATQKLLLLK